MASNDLDQLWQLLYSDIEDAPGSSYKIGLGANDGRAEALQSILQSITALKQSHRSNDLDQLESDIRTARTMNWITEEVFKDSLTTINNLQEKDK